MEIPSYRIHKPSGRAVVTLSGHDHYLGEHGSEASRREYDRLIALWLANGREPLESKLECSTVSDVADEFIAWARRYYRKGDRETSQVAIVVAAMHDLTRLFGGEDAHSFGPLKLELLMSHWVRNGVSRDLINRQAKIVRQAFRHAVRHQVIAPAIWEGIRAVPGLRQGRTEARETPGVNPVPNADLQRVIRHLGHSHLSAMISLQLFTGMRPGEIVSMTRDRIDMGNSPWAYNPSTHKSEHHGKGRVIYLGPLARRVLASILSDCQDDIGLPIFHTSRGNPHTIRSYREALALACWHAGVRIFTPHQLRHNYATMIRSELGIEAAKIMLGHSRVETTQIYAEADERKAREVAETLG